MTFVSGQAPWNKGIKTGLAPANKGTGGRCAVEDCDGAIAGHGYCALHYSRWRRHGDPLVRKINGYKGDGITYRQAHNRVKQAKGRASWFDCEVCDNTAIDWAYDHRDPNEKYDVDNRPYSVDMGHYIPLCRRCHIRLDAGWFSIWRTRVG